MDIDKYLKSLTDNELIKKTDMCQKDLELASGEQNNTDWHQECFAAMIVYGGEMRKRGLKTNPNDLK